MLQLVKIINGEAIYEVEGIDFSKMTGKYRNTFPNMGGYDDNGKPVERTKSEYPYSYDGIVTYRDCDLTAKHTVYHDRLKQWDSDKYERSRMEAASTSQGELAGYFNDPKVVEEMLQLYYEDDTIRLVMIMEYCNQSSGYPCWRFDYTSNEGEKHVG